VLPTIGRYIDRPCIDRLWCTDNDTAVPGNSRASLVLIILCWSLLRTSDPKLSLVYGVNSHSRYRASNNLFLTLSSCLCNYVKSVSYRSRITISWKVLLKKIVPASVLIFKYRCCNSLSHRDRIPSSWAWCRTVLEHCTNVPLDTTGAKIYFSPYTKHKQIQFLFLLDWFVESIIALLGETFFLQRKLI
jgi:hypothetical protein